MRFSIVSYVSTSSFVRIRGCHVKTADWFETAPHPGINDTDSNYDESLEYDTLYTTPC